MRVGYDIEIEFSGLRPGEKLFEELSYKGENFLPTQHPKIIRFVSEPPPFELLQKQLEALFTRVQDAERLDIKMALKQLVPAYQPDLVHHVSPAATRDVASPPAARPAARDEHGG